MMILARFQYNLNKIIHPFFSPHLNYTQTRSVRKQDPTDNRKSRRAHIYRDFFSDNNDDVHHRGIDGKAMTPANFLVESAELARAIRNLIGVWKKVRALAPYYVTHELHEDDRCVYVYVVVHNDVRMYTQGKNFLRSRCFSAADDANAVRQHSRQSHLLISSPRRPFFVEDSALLNLCVAIYF